MISEAAPERTGQTTVDRVWVHVNGRIMNMAKEQLRDPHGSEYWSPTDADLVDLRKVEMQLAQEKRRLKRRGVPGGEDEPSMPVFEPDAVDESMEADAVVAPVEPIPMYLPDPAIQMDESMGITGDGAPASSDSPLEPIVVADDGEPPAVAEAAAEAFPALGGRAHCREGADRAAGADCARCDA